jgi:L-asparaginase II
MLALAKFNGWPVGGYESARHPVQQLLLKTVAEFAGLEPDQVHVGVDGCSVSTFGMSVHSMALSFARLAQPDFWPEPRGSAVRRIAAAMVEYPEMVAARQGRLDTDLMRAAGGRLIAKAGAEGVYCVALLATEEAPSLGFAMKLLDGDPMGRARNPAVVEGLRQAGLLDEGALGKLEKYWMEEVRNRPGDVVGMVRPAFTLSVSG